MYLMEVPAKPRPRPAAPVSTTFHPGVNHAHAATGRWSDVQKGADKQCSTLRRRALRSPTKIPGMAEAMAVECACANLSPRNVARVVRNTIMAVLPLARKHLDHYLNGSGADLKVDLVDVIRRDPKVRAKLAAAVRGHSAGHFKIHQSDYAVKDFQFAFGAIDRLDYEVDRARGLVHIWFKDRYEWHPVGFGYKLLPGDVRRSSNCVHAAMVELKRSGAKDYWMVGEARIPLSALSGKPGPSGLSTRAL